MNSRWWWWWRCYCRWWRTDYHWCWCCQSSGTFGTSRGAAMSCDWEGNRRPGITLAMHHRLWWFIHLRAHGLSIREMSTPPTLLMGYATLFLHWCSPLLISGETLCSLLSLSAVTVASERHRKTNISYFYVYVIYFWKNFFRHCQTVFMQQQDLTLAVVETLLILLMCLIKWMRNKKKFSHHTATYFVISFYSYIQNTETVRVQRRCS